MWSTIAGLLLLPLVAMQFTSAVAWDAGDFAAAGLLLVGAGAVYEVAARLTASSRRRAAIFAALVLGVLLFWIEGAVGIFS